MTRSAGPETQTSNQTAAMDNNTLVSVLVVLRNDEAILQDLLRECRAACEAHYGHFEILLVDNGSTDRTVEIARAAMESGGNVRLLVLAREYDEEIAWFAALENCIGDYAVLLEARQDPPDLIPRLVEACREGADAVVAEQPKPLREALLYRLLAWLFYRIFSRLSGRRVPMEWSNCACFSRKAVNAVLQVKDRVRYLKYLTASLGCRMVTLPYERRPRGGGRRSGRRLFQGLRRALDVTASSSDTLIRSASLLSFGFSLLSLGYLLYTLAVFLFKADVAEGWSSLSAVLATLFFALFFILGILCEYVALISKETKSGPLYVILDEISCSRIFQDMGGRNVRPD
jgi:dolichol-phosphate mannosyltransferase